MNTHIKKFLEFNGKVIYFVAHDGVYWIALKPLCDALEVEYTNEYKKVKKHGIFKRRVANMAMRDTKNRLQNMVALPEKYIYGWLTSISSDKDAFLEYLEKCYDLLYEYFHGSITGRHQVLLEKSDALTEMEQLEKELANDPKFTQWNEARAKVMRYGKKLKELDDDFIEGQLSINFQTN